jgi:hypothetical protein
MEQIHEERLAPPDAAPEIQAAHVVVASGSLEAPGDGGEEPVARSAGAMQSLAEVLEAVDGVQLRGIFRIPVPPQRLSIG